MSHGFPTWHRVTEKKPTGISRMAPSLAFGKELVVIFLLVAITAIIFFFVSNQRAFLNFFYLPVLLGAYFFGKRYATLAALFSIILISVVAYFHPASFSFAGHRDLERWLDIGTWGGFLLVTGYLMGMMYEKKRLPGGTFTGPTAESSRCSRR